MLPWKTACKIRRRENIRHDNNSHFLVFICEKVRTFDEIPNLSTLFPKYFGSNSNHRFWMRCILIRYKLTASRYVATYCKYVNYIRNLVGSLRSSFLEWWSKVLFYDHISFIIIIISLLNSELILFILSYILIY